MSLSYPFPLFRNFLRENIESQAQPQQQGEQQNPLSSTTETTSFQPEEEQTNRNESSNENPQQTEITFNLSQYGRAELRSFGKWIERSLAFVFILFIVFLYRHANGIAMFLWNTVVLYNITQIFKKQVAKKDSISISVILVIVSTLSLHVFATYFLFFDLNLWRYLLLRVPRNDERGIWDIFWIVTTNDTMVRFCSQIIKCLIILVFGHGQHNRSGHLYCIVETLSHLYRMILPLPLWFLYLIGDREVFSLLMSVLYLAVKGNRIVDKLKILFFVSKAWALGELQYGKFASPEQVNEVGDLCAICQEKMNSPIVLQCNHIFCEGCVGEWFERESTCPLCRAHIASAGNRTHSDGSTTLFVELF